MSDDTLPKPTVQSIAVQCYSTAIIGALTMQIATVEREAKAAQMAKDLHDKGWTFQRFSDAMHAPGVLPYEVTDDIGEELSRLDKGARQ